MSKKGLPYPRPVSPLDIDEAPICPSTIVYFDPHAHETEDEAEQRAAKRRKRVRENAEAYLRGESIYIMTATLKGPFEAPWKNPWAKKMTRGVEQKEIPATAVGNTTRKSLAVPETIRDGQRYVECIDLTGDDIEFTQPPIVQDKPPKDVFSRSKSPVRPAPSHLAPTSAKRVEEWLRTNDAYKSRHLPDIRSSPTPTNREYRSLREESQSKRPTSAGGGERNTQVGEWAKKFSPQQEHTSTQQTHESQERAEAAILEAKRRSVHKVPASTNLPAFEYKRPKRQQERPQEVVQHPLTPESGSDAGDIEHDVPNDRDVPDGQAVQKSAIPDNATAFKKPTLSAETSKATTIRDLPEAQVVSAVIPEASNAQSTAELLQPVEGPAEYSLTEGQGTAPDQTKPPSEAGLVATTDQPASGGRLCADEQTPSAAPAAPSPGKNDRTPMRNLDTQALVGNIQPFAISTIKKLTAITEEKSTPVTASKPSKAKAGKSNKKKASFAAEPASDESQSSIKAGFQVRKSASIQVIPSSKADGTNPEDEDEAYDLDPPTNRQTTYAVQSHHKARTPLPKPALKTKTPVPKSIPKSRAPNPAAHSSAPPATTVTATNASSLAITQNGTYHSTSGTSGTKQDAQPRPTMGGGDMFAIENGTGVGFDEMVGVGAGDEHFDLDTAVEELGSFLGTWDVEREVCGRV